MDVKLKVDGIFDTIIIGAGLSGLSAATRLTKYGQKVLVLEARDRVGGRTYTVQDDNHGTVDLGGAYIGPTQNRVYRLAKELDLEFYNVNERESTVMDLKKYLGKFKGSMPSFWNPFILLDLNNVTRTIDIMAKEVPCEAPWNAKKAEEWDAMTVAQFLPTITWTDAARNTVEIFVRGIFCVEPCEVSLLYLLWYIHSGGGITRLASITNGAQEKKILGGTQQLSEGMMNRLGSQCVKLSCPVIRIEQTEGGVTVTDIHGKQYTSKYVVSAVPQSLLNRITFEPSLPWEKVQLAQRVPMGSIIKTNMFYKSPFWRNFGMCGSASSWEGVCCYCVDDTKPDGSHPAIMGFVLADKARQMALLEPSQRKQALCEHYARVFGCDDFLQPTGYMENNWMADQYAGGCYVSVMPPNVLTKYARYMKKPFDRVYFAGTETASLWAGYMDGAIQAGERAANQILHTMGKIDEDQIDEEEPESVDFPADPVPFSYLEWYLPSVSTLVKLSVAGLIGFSAYSFYFFLFGWKGSLMLKWLKWRYDFDDYTVQDLSRYVKNIF